MTSERSRRPSRRVEPDPARRKVVICGAGGHGRVVADVLDRAGLYEVTGFLDDESRLTGTKIGERSVLGMISGGLEQIDPAWCVIVGVGSNAARRKLAERVEKLGLEIATAVDPSAQVGSDVVIGSGTVVMPNAVINTGARIGAHAIVNTAASVDHDCMVGDFVHICPGVHLAGGVAVGTGTILGIGSCVIPGVRIGEWTTVGAGSTVIYALPDGITAFGTPARPVSGSETQR